MSKDSPLIGHWRPARPYGAVLASLGAGKTYSAEANAPTNQRKQSTHHKKEDHE